jgi:hypothetical protein
MKGQFQIAFFGMHFNKTIVKDSKLGMPITCENSKKVAKKNVVAYFLRRDDFCWRGFFFSSQRVGGF